MREFVLRALGRLRQPDVSDHVEYNRTSWDSYAARWRSRGFRRSLRARGVDVDGLEVLGEEWASLDGGVRDVIRDWIWPYVSAGDEVAEIGVGGGRVAVEVAGRVASFHGFDISAAMLKHARETLGRFDNVELELLEKPRLPDRLSGRLDFVYSFDVFVHLDVHTQWRYIQETERVLRPGGKAFFHTTNLTAPAGWERFAEQDRYTLDGHYFVTPDLVRTLVARAGLTMIAESRPDPANSVLNRDYLVVVEKPLNP